MKAKAETRMAPRPTQVAAAPIRAGTRVIQGVATASIAPRASSQARVSGEK